MSKQLKVLELFAGLGGFSLGMEETGFFRTIAFVEINNFCQRVLHKHWPSVYIHSDIRTLTASHFDGYERPDVITAGVPCQPSSRAGKQKFADDDRWLWPCTINLIGALRPRYAVLENPSGLLDGGIREVLGSLAEIGFDAEWGTVCASDFGAPCEGERLLIFAAPAGERLPRPWTLGYEVHPTPDRYREAIDVVDAVQKKALPFVCGRHHGFPAGLDEASLMALGNSIDPGIANWAGMAIAEAEGLTR